MLIKNVFIGLFAVVAFSTSLMAQDVERFLLNTESSTIIWQGYKVTGEHAGTIDLKNGNLDFDNGEFTGGGFVIDMATIVNTDLEGEWKTKLEGHLKSPDFFGVEQFPTASFEITRVISRGTPGDYKVVGNLTIKETTKEIKFLIHLDDSTPNKTVATASITIDRSDFDVRYGSGSFFDGLKDKTIYDEFDLEIELEVSK